MKKSPRRQCVTEAHLGLLTNPHWLRPQNLSLQTSTKNIVALNFAFTWKKQEIYAAKSELQGTDIPGHKTWKSMLRTTMTTRLNNLWSRPGDPNNHPHSPPLHHNMTKFSTPMFTPAWRLSLRSNESETKKLSQISAEWHPAPLTGNMRDLVEWGVCESVWLLP